MLKALASPLAVPGDGAIAVQVFVEGSYFEKFLVATVGLEAYPVPAYAMPLMVKETPLNAPVGIAAAELQESVWADSVGGTNRKQEMKKYKRLKMEAVLVNFAFITTTGI